MISIIRARIGSSPSRIRAKLEELLALDGAEDVLEVLVLDDGSTDGTAGAALAAHDARIEVVSLPARGKAAAIAEGIRRARGDVIVFCDVRQRIEKVALRALLAPFADPEVGVVSGALHMPDARGLGLYWRYERALRRAESATGSVVGATGALYAIRRALATPPPDGALLDDVLVSLAAAMHGARIVLADEARVHDIEAQGAGELSRKARTIAGTWQLLALAPELLVPTKNPLWARFVLHKLARLFLPLSLATVLACDVALAAQGDAVRATFATLQLACWLVAALAAAGAPLGRGGRALHAFALMQVAAVLGAARFARGDLRWTRAPSAGPNESVPVRAAGGERWASR